MIKSLLAKIVRKPRPRWWSGHDVATLGHYVSDEPAFYKLSPEGWLKWDDDQSEFRLLRSAVRSAVLPTVPYRVYGPIPKDSLTCVAAR